MYDDLNSLSRQLKMDNFAFLEIEEKNHSNNEKTLSNITTKKEPVLSENIKEEATSITQEKTDSNQSAQPELDHFMDYKHNYYHNPVASEPHLERIVILSDLFSSISKK
ncbi:hypothetical protein G3341_03860 [Providencia vermicola]|uniref:hypothetical protein n=1 Tax=Providencia vermicola TaxID=333965 RepID=UPI0013A7B517|nr:hypothetical protein [Providencia vermicola]QIC14895.1 hypothetical protein G3341_03860 [Providencia vermicola]